MTDGEFDSLTIIDLKLLREVTGPPQVYVLRDMTQGDSWWMTFTTGATPKIKFNKAAVELDGGKFTFYGDTTLYRADENILKTDDTFVANEIQVGSSVLKTDQYGSIELGDSSQSGTVPYIDFHYGKSGSEDYNVRLQNYGDKLFTIKAISSGGTLNLVNMELAFEGDAKLYRGESDYLYTDNNFRAKGHISATRSNPADGFVQLWDDTAILFSNAHDLRILKAPSIYGSGTELMRLTTAGQLKLPVQGSSGGIVTNGKVEMSCEAPYFSTWQGGQDPLEPYLWELTWDGNEWDWTADGNILDLGDSFIRFKDTAYPNNTVDIGIIRGPQEPTDPMLWVSRSLTVKKDFACGGAASVFQGALILGSDWNAHIPEGQMPQIYLAHSEGSPYPDDPKRDTLQIWRAGYVGFAKMELGEVIFGDLSDPSRPIHLHRITRSVMGTTVGTLQVKDGNGMLATLDASNVCVDHIDSASSGGIYLFDDLKPYSVGGTNIGTYTQYFGEVNAKSFVDRGCPIWIDEDEAITILKGINPHPTLKSINKLNGKEVPQFDYSALPAILKPEDGDGIKLDTLVYCIYHAIRKLITKADNLNS